MKVTFDGNDFDISKIKGKKVMIVNITSKCGLAPQYEQLQQRQINIYYLPLQSCSIELF